MKQRHGALVLGLLAGTIAVAVAAAPVSAASLASARADKKQPRHHALGTTKKPAHHTVTIGGCPVVFCVGRFTINTSDGGTWSQKVGVAGGATVIFTFTSLTGGGAAIDVANPFVSCNPLGGSDTVTIPMGPGSSVTGGPIALAAPFTVPVNVAATMTITCG